MAKKGTSFWVNIGSGAIAVLAIAAMIVATSKCSGAEQENTQTARALASARAEIEQKDETIADLNEGIEYLKAENKMQKDSIDVMNQFNKDIKAENDSLKVNCVQKKKKTARKPAAKPAAKPATKPCVTPSVTVVSGDKKVVVGACGEEKPSVKVTSAEKKVVVCGQDETKDQGRVIVNGDNNGQIIVNTNGIVEANGNVNGHDNNVNSASKGSLEGYAIVRSRAKCR
ncbi:MAG: hypothetical protein J6Y49_02515 [Alphaproteobacteria bacterium]|nr:hypothetical protein [Alphaproteobacteria bacterium]